MKRKLRGLKRRDIQLDFDLYRVDVPIRGLSNVALSVVDIWPEGAEETMRGSVFCAACPELVEGKQSSIADSEIASQRLLPTTMGIAS